MQDTSYTSHHRVTWRWNVQIPHGRKIRRALIVPLCAFCCNRALSVGMICEPDRLCP